MKITKLALSLLVSVGTGCATAPPAPVVSLSSLPNCFDTNYDEKRALFTMRNADRNAVNQQCLLTVGPRGEEGLAGFIGGIGEAVGGLFDAVTGLFTEGPRVSTSRLTAGRYAVSLSNGGGGGAGGTLRDEGGGGGGGAGAAETKATLDLTEGVYKLTIGAGGLGGNACTKRADGQGYFGGGPGWLGSPSNIVRVATGEVVMGTPGADRHVRGTRVEHEKGAGKQDGHGGSGPGQTSGGHSGFTEDKTAGGAKVEAGPGGGKPSGSAEAQIASARSGASPSGASPIALASSTGGGAPGYAAPKETRSGPGGGGGGTSIGGGGAGGGEMERRMIDIAPTRGSLGGGGGGGEGNSFQCDPGAQGGHGFIALRPI